jgi:hypothetical protein
LQIEGRALLPAHALLYCTGLYLKPPVKFRLGQPQLGHNVLIVKTVSFGIALCLFAATSAFPQKTVPRASIAFSFAVDGESVPCVHRGIELQAGGRVIPVRPTAYGFIIPPAFRRAVTGKATQVQKVDVRITCGGQVFDFPNEDESRLVPGSWLLEVSYPTTWFTSATESPVLESGTWLTAMIWGCRQCQPVPRTVIPHFDLPSAFADRLRREQPTAQGVRAVQIAYALVVFNVEPEKNLAYLTDLLKACVVPAETPPDAAVCNNAQLAEDLVNLYWRGDSELLGSLLELADSHSEVASEMGDFYADLLDRRPNLTLRGLQALAPEMQLAACVRAGENEREGDGTRFRRIRMNLHAVGSVTARQCLQQAEAAFH